MKHRTLAAILIAIIVLLVASQCLFTVPAGHTGVVLRWQQVARHGLAPGLHAKLPFLAQVRRLDSGWILLDGQRENGGLEKVTSKDPEPLELGYVLLWRIKDAAAFCTRNPGCDQSQGAYHINQAALTLLKQAFLAHTADDALSASLQHILPGVVTALNHELAASGIEVHSMHITHLGLTATAQDIVYARMRSAQSAAAAKLRAEGVAAADRIKADADQKRASLLAQGHVEAQKVRAAADADAARTYAKAARQDRGFFRFYLSLQTYRRAMQQGQRVIVLGPDSPLLKYLDAEGGK